MYAIVDIAGMQIKVEKDQEIFTPKLPGKPGSKIEFKDVLLVDSDGNVKIGEPMVKGAKVSGKIIEHLKGDKVLIFKKKKRKDYVRKRGHRQEYSKVLIEEIKN
jgi:large subunit ribosomal protein L21